MDGGPAFPRPASEDTSGGTLCDGNSIMDAQRGMSLRDYFAGQALVGIMSDPGMRPCNESEFGHMAMRLYQVADAMLVERAKGGES